MKKIFYQFISYDDIISYAENKRIQFFLTQVNIGENSKLYNECIVENIKEDKNSIRIGKNSHIRGELTLSHFGEILSIGDNSYIGKWSVVRAYEKVIIGNSVLISHNVTIIDSDSHEIDHIERSNSFIKMVTVGHPRVRGNIITAPIVICDYVWISYGAAILKGVTIGKGAIVGANSVVTRDVPSWTVVAGNPAIVIKHLKGKV